MHRYVQSLSAMFGTPRMHSRRLLLPKVAIAIKHDACFGVGAEVKETHTSAKAACTAADLTLTATRGLRAATAVSNASREGVSYGKMRNSGMAMRRR
jgi:hypothetical protein